MKSKILKKLVLNQDMAYIIGVLIGDGHISDKTKSKTDLSLDYRISIELTDYDLLKYIESLIKKFVKTKSTVNKVKKRKGKKQTYVFQMRNKELYKYLTDDIKLPKGNKTSKLRVPIQIIGNVEKIRKAFIAGFFDTDGGRRGNSIGFTMKNKALQEDISSLLNKFNINHSCDCWLNKKYNTHYYGLKLKINEIKTFLYDFPLRNKNRLNEILSLV